MFKSVVIFLVLGFFGVAVLGALAMNPMSDHSHRNGCIASLANGFNCSGDSGSFGFAYFHIDAFKSFSSATLASVFADLVLWAAAFSLLTGFIIFGSLIFDLSPEMGLTEESRSFLEKTSSSQRRVLHWWALHENSPSSVVSCLRQPECNR